MSVQYVPVQWTRRKVIYDAVVIVGVIVYIATFSQITRATHTGPDALTDAIVAFRAYGSCAFLMLTMILCIGPLSRIDRRFLPLLYNRRHFGVIMFLVAAYHAYQVLEYYHAYSSDTSKLMSLLTNDAAVTASSLPFQLFGATALLVFFVMFATSHDFWQKMLGPRGWKSLHMLVYGAYALVILHVAYGALQFEVHPAFGALVAASVLLVVSLHIVAARRSNALDAAGVAWVERDGDKWIDAGTPETIPEDRARPVFVPDGERIALIRYEGKVSALHGVCAHQGGPLYEGKVVFGCLTCPWHGWQYRPQDGCSPPPFQEKLPTYRVALAGGRVLVDPRPLAPGTPVEPVVFDQAAHEAAQRAAREAASESEQDDGDG